MKKPRNILLTTIVRNYVLQFIAKAGAKPERLLSEMRLCKKFGVSRITVRRALEDLKQQKYLIQLPGREGFFTNPQMASAVPYLIGIICGQGSRNYVDSNSVEILTAFMNDLQDLNCDFEFLTLNSENNTETFNTLSSLPLDGIFWLMPPDRYISVINLLLEKACPLVIIDSIFNSETLKAKSNTIIRDYVYHAKCQAQKMIDMQFKNVIRIGAYNISAQTFDQELQKNGIFLPKNFFIEKPDDILLKLPELMEAKQIDALICTGGPNRYNNTFQILNANNKWSKIPIFLEASHFARLHKQKKPALNIILLPTYYDRKELGINASKKMKLILTGKQKSFRNYVVNAEKT